MTVLGQTERWLDGQLRLSASQRLSDICEQTGAVKPAFTPVVAI